MGVGLVPFKPDYSRLVGVRGDGFSVKRRWGDLLTPDEFALCAAFEVVYSSKSREWISQFLMGLCVHCLFCRIDMV